MIYVTGDCHADFLRFGKYEFPEQKGLSKDDTVIICGDFGGVWKDTPEEKYWLDWLNDRSFTTLFVDGNHENFDRLYSNEFERVEYKGGQVHKVRDTVLHLIRGYNFAIEGKVFFAFGGGKSHDISDGIIDRDMYQSDKEFRNAIRRANELRRMCRVNHESWWEQEMPSQEEYNQGLTTLYQSNNKVDYIISHCCPQEVASLLGFIEGDELTKYFDWVRGSTQFTKWYFGHYHIDKEIDDRYVALYKQIRRIDAKK